MATLDEKHGKQVLAWTSRTCEEGHLPEYWIYPIWPIQIIFKSWSWWKRHWVQTRPPDTFATVYHLGFVRVIVGMARE